jgi:hypothetical protein
MEEEFVEQHAVTGLLYRCVTVEALGDVTYIVIVH